MAGPILTRPARIWLVEDLPGICSNDGSVRCIANGDDRQDVTVGVKVVGKNGDLLSPESFEGLWCLGLSEVTIRVSTWLVPTLKVSAERVSVHTAAPHANNRTNSRRHPDDRVDGLPALVDQRRNRRQPGRIDGDTTLHLGGRPEASTRDDCRRRRSVKIVRRPAAILGLLAAMAATLRLDFPARHRRYSS